MAEWRTHIFLPDFQIPYHDRKFTETLIKFVGAINPDTVTIVGDYSDQPEPARWNKGMAGEFAPTLFKGFDECKQVLADIRNVYDGPLNLRMGNHDERVETYVRKYAPALGSLPGLQFETLIDADEYDVQVKRTMFDVAPGWVCAHGHEGSLNRVSGGTAMSLARSIHKSVVCGHTHKLGLQSESNGYNGRLKDLHGLEVGHAMDIRKAHYLKKGAASWQQGFGVLLQKGTTVLPHAVKAHRGTFVWEGQEFGRGAP